MSYVARKIEFFATFLSCLRWKIELLLTERLGDIQMRDVPVVLTTTMKLTRFIKTHLQTQKRSLPMAANAIFKPMKRLTPVVLVTLALLRD